MWCAQVVVGRISKALQRSPVSSQDRCFSLVSAKPGALSPTVASPSTPSTGGSASTPTTSTARRSSFLFGGGDKDKDKASLDLELTSESGISVEELVAGLRLLGATGGLDMVEAVMRRTSLQASGGVFAALSSNGKDT